MTTGRDPIVEPIPILSLRPTQVTVGLREVREKRKRWRQHKAKRRAEFLGRHMIPVVKGIHERYYVIDHHHLARALYEEDVEHVLVSVIADLTMVDRTSFWTVMDNHRWVHPYDAKGVRRSFTEIPETVDKLVDDPFRSLAGELRRAGGYAKDTTPFSEFLWADYLRGRIPRKMLKRDFSQALERALELARRQDAIYLPGWCGPAEEP